MNIHDLILNSSSFNYSLGHLGKNTENSNPKPISIFDFFDIACNQGFGGVEFPLFRFCNHESTNIEKIYDYLNSNNLFCQFDCGNPIDIDEIKKIIPIAKRFKSDIIRIKVSNILCCNRKIIDHGWDSFINSIIKKLRSLIPYLNDYQIKLAIENHQDVDSLDLINIIDKVDSDYIGVNFDIGNAFATLEYPLEFAKKMGDRIILINLKDYKFKKSKYGFRLIQCPFLDGVVPFEDLFIHFRENLASIKMSLEIGALQSRNIEKKKSEFWKNFRKISEKEKLDFFNFVEENLIDKNSDWMTPWEKDQSGDLIIKHELNQVVNSVENLRAY